MPVAFLLRPATSLPVSNWFTNTSRRQTFLPRSFSWCQQATCLPVRGCSGNGDEQPLHIQPGSPPLGRYDPHQLVPLAVQRCQTLQPARYAARQALEGSRTAVRLHAPVAVVAVHRLQVSSHLRLVAISPDQEGPVIHHCRMNAREASPGQGGCRLRLPLRREPAAVGEDRQ